MKMTRRQFRALSRSGKYSPFFTLRLTALPDRRSPRCGSRSSHLGTRPGGSDLGWNRSAHCRELVGSMRISGIAGGVDVISRRWAEAGNLDNNGFVPGFGKMTLAWWFCVIASRRKRLKFRLVEAISVSDAPRTGNHSCDAIVAMGMGCDPGMRGHAKHNRVDPSLIRIAFQDRRSDACNSGASRTWIASLRVLILCRRQALFRRSVEKSTDQGYCLNRAFLHQPV